MLLGLRQRGIEPMVTLHHFTHPAWLEEQRAWEDTDVIVPRFQRYTKQVESAGRFMRFVVPDQRTKRVCANGYLSGGRMPPGVSDFDRTLNVLRNMLIAHAAAYETLHTHQKLARVGIAHHMRVFRGCGQVISSMPSSHTDMSRCLTTVCSMP